MLLTTRLACFLDFACRFPIFVTCPNVCLAFALSVLFCLPDLYFFLCLVDFSQMAASIALRVYCLNLCDVVHCSIFFVSRFHFLGIHITLNRF